jgi:hypothetical protein
MVASPLRHIPTWFSPDRWHRRTDARHLPPDWQVGPALPSGKFRMDELIFAMFSGLERRLEQYHL